MVWPALIAAGASLIGGAQSSKGQRAANASNERIAKDNRNFQERMSNSAFQRSSKDLELAGLNRILAYGNPASTPSGATATYQNDKAGIAEGIRSAPASALAARLQAQTFKNLQKTGDVLDTQALKNQADTQFTNSKNAAIGPASTAAAGVTDYVKQYFPSISKLNNLGSKAGKAAANIKQEYLPYKMKKQKTFQQWTNSRNRFNVGSKTKGNN
jgi:hypothetical protein